MGTEEIEFEKWWAEFVAEAQANRDDYSSIQALRGYIAGLPHEKRRSFEHCLVDLVSQQQPGASLALAALERAALPETYEALISLARLSPASGTELREGTLRALAHSGLPQAAALLEQYLLHEPIGANWSSVPWALWPQASSLFCRAWSRYFTEKPPEVWRGTAIVQAFLREPRALRSLRGALQAHSASAWAQFQNALREESDAPWLTEAERSSLLSELDA